MTVFSNKRRIKKEEGENIEKTKSPNKKRRRSTSTTSRKRVKRHSCDSKSKKKVEENQTDKERTPLTLLSYFKPIQQMHKS